MTGPVKLIGLQLMRWHVGWVYPAIGGWHFVEIGLWDRQRSPILSALYRKKACRVHARDLPGMLRAMHCTTEGGVA